MNPYLSPESETWIIGDVHGCRATLEKLFESIDAQSPQSRIYFVGDLVGKGPESAGVLEFVMNLVTPDNGERFVVELSNATLTNIQGYTSDNAQLTLTVKRTDLERVMSGETTLDALLADGTAQFEGDIAILGQLAGLMVEFDPRFEIMPGTKLRTPTAAAGDFEATVGAVIPE